MRKRCTKCKARRLLKMFSAHPATRDKLYPDCKKCRGEYSRIWKKNNPEAAVPWRLANKKKINGWSKAWRKRNEEATRKINAAWYAANRGKRSAYTAAHKAAKLKATPAWADLKKIAKIYERAAARGLSVDHIVPLRSPIVCGLHVHNNLRPLAGGKNSAKGNRRWPDMPSERRI